MYHMVRKEFISKLNQYANEDTQFGKPKNDKLFRSIESVNIALLRSLWTDNINEFPTKRADWYEIWIRTNDLDTIEEQHKSFIDTLNALHIQYKENSILTLKGLYSWFMQILKLYLYYYKVQIKWQK